jgi:hypothetical protein
MQGTTMYGYWSPGNPVRTDNPNVLATAYVKDGNVLVALASWDENPADVMLTIDWKTLGLDPSKVMFVAPPIDAFQTARRFTPSEKIPLEPGKGWVLVLTNSRGEK